MDIGVIVILWAFFAILIAVAARARGRNPAAWFFVSLILSPILALLLLIAFPILRRSDRAAFDDAELMKNIERGRRGRR